VENVTLSPYVIEIIMHLMHGLNPAGSFIDSDHALVDSHEVGVMIGYVLRGCGWVDLAKQLVECDRSTKSATKLLRSEVIAVVGGVIERRYLPWFSQLCG
jgi:hypothetical protein